MGAAGCLFAAAAAAAACRLPTPDLGVLRFSGLSFPAEETQKEL